MPAMMCSRYLSLHCICSHSSVLTATRQAMTYGVSVQPVSSGSPNMQSQLWLPHLFRDVLYVKVAPPVLGHRLDGRELGYAAVVVGRRQLRHREADDPQRLAHCAVGTERGSVSTLIRPAWFPHELPNPRRRDCTACLVSIVRSHQVADDTGQCAVMLSHSHMLLVCFGQNTY